MGRPPSNGVPAFRFTQQEVAEMETVLQGHNCAVPAREVLVALAEKFSASPDRQGKIVVQMKQVWNWFQNRRYALRAKSAKTPEKLGVSPQQPIQPIVPVPSMPAMPSITQDDRTPPASVPQSLPHSSGQNVARIIPDNSPLEFEAKSARDGAWYDVGSFLAHRHWETGDPEVLVRFSGFGKEEDEWINVKRNVRPRSLPCEASECVAVLPGDLILCFQEGKEQALYYDAHVLDSQRRRHDVRGCRCRFLVRYDHDQSEEIVPLRKICRRPETDYRLQQLNAAAAVNPSPGGETTDQQKDVANLQTGRDTADQQRSDADPSKRGPNSPEMLQPSHDAAEDAGCEASQANASPVTAAGAAPGPKNEGTANAVNEAADGCAVNAAMVDCSVANEQEANAVV